LARWPVVVIAGPRASIRPGVLLGLERCLVRTTDTRRASQIHLVIAGRNLSPGPGLNLAYRGDDENRMRRRLSERWFTFPPAAWFVVIQLEFGALSVLERLVVRAWGGVPVAVGLCLFVAPMIALLRLNRRFIGVVPTAVVEAERATDSALRPSTSGVAVGRA
jgi:hypothetical protein